MRYQDYERLPCHDIIFPFFFRRTRIFPILTSINSQASIQEKYMFVKYFLIKIIFFKGFFMLIH